MAPTRKSRSAAPAENPPSTAAGRTQTRQRCRRGSTKGCVTTFKKRQERDWPSAVLHVHGWPPEINHVTFPDSFVLLQQDGYLIRTSLSGDEGIEEAAGGRVDLLYLDTATHSDSAVLKVARAADLLFQARGLATREER